jgi:spermidine/putrescine transport system substrate-binding protein
MIKFRVLRAAALLAAAALVFAGCQKKTAGAAAAEETKLYIYNWTYYCPDAIIAGFEKEYGIDIIYDEFASNEDMYAKIQAGGTGYDLVFPSAEFITIMIAQGMLEKLDKTQLTNLGNIDPRIIEKAVYDPQLDYHVPYYYGAAGVIVNTLKVPQYEESWNIFARSDLAGRMTMLDDPREVLGAALRTLGYSANSRSREEIMAARDLINTRWAPNLTRFDAEAFPKAFAAGDFWVVQGYYESVLEEISGDSRLLRAAAFFIPREGGTAYLDGMCILKGAKHPRAAHKFIDYIHRPEIYAGFTDYYHYPSTVNIPARALKTEPPYISEETLLQTELKYDTGSALDYYNEAWFDSIRLGK